MSDRPDDLARAAALLEANRPQQARELLARLIAADPTSAQAWLAMARACGELGDYETQLAAALQVLDLEPDSGDGMILAAYASVELRSFAQARSFADAAVRTMPDDWYSHAVLAEAASAGPPRDLRVARAAAAQAVRLAPHIADAHVVQGNVEFNAANPQAAKRFYLRALELDPQSTTAREMLGVAHLNQGEIDSGAKHIGGSLADAPASLTGGWAMDAVLGTLVARSVWSLASVWVVNLFVVLASGKRVGWWWWSLITLVPCAIAIGLLARTIARMPRNVRASLPTAFARSRWARGMLAIEVLLLMLMIGGGSVPDPSWRRGLACVVPLAIVWFGGAAAIAFERRG